MKMSKIRYVAIAAVFAMIFALPATLASARQWYVVNNPGSHIDMYSEAGHRKGKLRCRPAHGEKFSIEQYIVGNRYTTVGGKRYIYVSWRKRLGTMEWHWKDRFRKWCPLWDRKGWVELDLVRPIETPGGHWIF